MIITVTLNPAIDHTLVVDEFVPGDTNRVRESRTDPGGKGINVARVLRELGGECLVLGFVSGGLGRFIEHTLNDLGIPDDLIHTPGQTRTNITIVDLNKGIHTMLSNRGPETDPRHLVELRHRMRKHITGQSWVIIGGSIPPGLEPRTHAELIAFAKERGALTVLDADGEALALGIEAKPHMVKPNVRELQRLLGRRLTKMSEILAAAEQIHHKGIEIVVASEGTEGAIAVSREDRWRALCPKVEVVSAVGSGDALMAGLVHVLSQGGSLKEALRLGTAAGVATCLSPGTMLCCKNDIEKFLPLVKVSKIG